MSSRGFRIRKALQDDVLSLHELIESSVRGLQREDYTLAQIQGALGHALGLDTQLIQDETYFLAVVAVGCEEVDNQTVFLVRNSMG